ncbi:MAG TPA: DUF1592 domain-containing protein [Polyangiaceae bacterium]
MSQLRSAMQCGAVLLSVAAGACTAHIQGQMLGGQPSANAGANASGGGSATGSGGTTAAGGMAVADTPPKVPAPLRRLNQIEYDNTIADLLGDTSQPSKNFSADVAQDGFTNSAFAQTVSPAQVEQYMNAAETLSHTATGDLAKLLGCTPAAGAEAACITPFISSFGKRAWRRPLTPTEQARLLAVFTNARAKYALDVSVQLVLQAFLESPNFIYLLEAASPTGAAIAKGTVVPLDGWEIASRLSYFLLGSMPDPVLLAAAERAELSTPEQVAAQARRLLTLPRARARIGLFFTEWLQLRNLDRATKDPVMFPDYKLELGAMMQTQVQMLTSSIILDQGGSATDLLTASYTFMTPELAPLYGVPAPAASGFTRVELNPAQRSGILTQAGLMASLAKSNQTDPVHRGKFVRERLLCQSVPPPPVNANITPPVVTPNSTTRDRFAQHRVNASCNACHTLMDPLGLGFEHYDAIGRWRDQENGLPIDATGDATSSDIAGPFNGAVELAHKLAQSPAVKDCLVQSWFRFAQGRSATAADDGHIGFIAQQFAGNAFKMSELLVAVTQSQAFRYQVVPDPNASASGGTGGAQ